MWGSELSQADKASMCSRQPTPFCPPFATQIQMMNRVPVDRRAQGWREGPDPWGHSELETALFSSSNLQALNQQVQTALFRLQASPPPGQQQDQMIKAACRRVLQLYSPQGSVYQQLDELNRIVVRDVARAITSESVAYSKYMGSVDTLVMPMERPVLAGSRDRQRTLELQPPGFLPR